MEGFRWKTLFALVLVLFTNPCSCEGPEQGIFQVTLTPEIDFVGVTKNLAEQTVISIVVNNCTGSSNYKIEWMIRFTECNELYAELKENSTSSHLRDIFSPVDEEIMYSPESYIAVQRSKTLEDLPCPSGASFLEDETDNSWTCYSSRNLSHCVFTGVPEAPPSKPKDGQAKAAKPGKATEPGKSARARRAPVTNKPAGTKPTAAAKPTVPVKSLPKKSLLILKHRVSMTNNRSGRFLLIVHLKPDKLDPKLNVKVTIEMKSQSGYLSATQTPLLIFYGVMCGVYSILCFIWLLMLAFQWRDLLRIQFWIGGVMLLGLLEKAVFYAEFEYLNAHGLSMPGAIIFAELVSCLKRSLARMLVVIVSLGYGITRPRLGRDLHWVMGAGMLYFILSSIEACLRVKGSEQHALIAILPLAVLDAVICWWVFKSLVDTTRTLRLRRNMVKLWLYRHFTNTLIFCVVAAVIFLIWSTKTHRWAVCVKKWHELWLDDAYWHVLFCVILVVIVILFRPTANNQRYAFSPLTDRCDEESEEPMLNDAFEGVKMRNVIGNRSESHASKNDDDLKWVEDNIPAAVADAALGAFDDSEEELVTNLERNKME